MKIAYIDCFSGISGDMFLAALLDAGLPLEHLRSSVSSIGFEENFEISTSQVNKGAIRSCQVDIRFDHSHHHRGLKDILNLLTSSQLKPEVIERSSAIFQTLAEAEAKVHGQRIDQVHFHEVGALDSIIDIVGAAVGLDYFGIEQLFASPLPAATGNVKTEHGLLPLPAPATLELMKRGKMTIVPSPATKELVTPTGAAILASQAITRHPSITIAEIGIGAGRRELPWPNILRLIIGNSTEGSPFDEIVVMETNIDDMNPQLFAETQVALFSAGALDVFFSPIQMKKNRPATMVSVILRRSDEHVIANILLRHTTTFGVRVNSTWRYEAERKFIKISFPYGEIQIKLKIMDGKIVMAMPEYEECRKIAENHNIPIIDVYQAAFIAAQEKIQL